MGSQPSHNPAQAFAKWNAGRNSPSRRGCSEGVNLLAARATSHGMTHQNQLDATDARSDELLALRCQLGERDAFDELIARWHEPLWRYLRRLSNSDDTARDLTQDTWVRVFRGIARLREPAKLRQWLFGVARNVAMDRLRKQYIVGSPADVNLDELPAAAEDVNLEEEFTTLEAGLATLPIIERETLTLFYLRELSLEEIAGLVEAPVGTVKSRLFRARQMLRRALTEIES
jgi:RNA polymerase sigma factor (sigma-70 family)